MSNILTIPASGSIIFNDGTAGSSTVPDLTGNAVSLNYDAGAGLNITSYNTGNAERFSVDGTEGRLFSVSDSLTGEIFSVNDIAGLPLINVYSDTDDVITIGTYSTNALVVKNDKVGIGTDTPSEALTVSGNISASGNIIVGGNINNADAGVVVDDDLDIVGELTAQSQPYVHEMLGKNVITKERIFEALRNTSIVPFVSVSVTAYQGDSQFLNAWTGGTVGLASTVTPGQGAIRGSLAASLIKHGARANGSGRGATIDAALPHVITFFLGTSFPDSCEFWFVNGGASYGNTNNATTYGLRTNISYYGLRISPKVDLSGYEMRLVASGVNSSTEHINDASNTTPIVITTGGSHLFTTGETVLVNGVSGNDAANGIWEVNVINSTSLELSGSAGNGAFIASTSESIMKVSDAVDYDTSITHQFTFVYDFDNKTISFFDGEFSDTPTLQITNCYFRDVVNQSQVQPLVFAVNSISSTSRGAVQIDNIKATVL